MSITNGIIEAYINPPDEAQSAKETDTMHTEVVRS